MALKQHKPLKIVIYKADWCSACKYIVPKLIHFLESHGIKDYEIIDVDECGEKCKDIQYVPTVKLNDKEIEIPDLVNLIKNKGGEKKNGKN